MAVYQGKGPAAGFALHSAQHGLGPRRQQRGTVQGARPAYEALDPGQRRRYADALFEKIQWRPEEPEYHLFSIDVESAAFTVVRNGEMTHQVWKET